MAPKKSTAVTKPTPTRSGEKVDQGTIEKTLDVVVQDGAVLHGKQVPNIPDDAFSTATKKLSEQEAYMMIHELMKGKEEIGNNGESYRCAVDFILLADKAGCLVQTAYASIAFLEHPKKVLMKGVTSSNRVAGSAVDPRVLNFLPLHRNHRSERLGPFAALNITRTLMIALCCIEFFSDNLTSIKTWIEKYGGRPSTCAPKAANEETLKIKSALINKWRSQHNINKDYKKQELQRIAPIGTIIKVATEGQKLDAALLYGATDVSLGELAKTAVFEGDKNAEMVAISGVDTI